jgi:hypothetical protein
MLWQRLTKWLPRSKHGLSLLRSAFPILVRCILAVLMGVWSLPRLYEVFIEPGKQYALPQHITVITDCMELSNNLGIDIQFRDDERATSYDFTVHDPFESYPGDHSELTIDMSSSSDSAAQHCHFVQVLSTFGEFKRASGSWPASVSPDLNQAVTVSTDPYFNAVTLDMGNTQFRKIQDQIKTEFRFETWFPHDIKMVFQFNQQDVLAPRSYVLSLFKYKVESKTSSTLPKNSMDIINATMASVSPHIDFDLGYDFEPNAFDVVDLVKEFDDLGNLVVSTKSLGGYVILKNLHRDRNRDTRLLYAGAIFAAAIALLVDALVRLAELAFSRPSDE